jgi:OFA family oxalate/formate antiporter-like MFS transporter
VTALRRWPVLVGGGLLNISLGTYYAWSVFVPALEKEFGWSRTQISWVPTIDVVMLASMFLVGGFVQRRYGSRVNAVVGGLLFSGGLFLASFSSSLTALYLTWGVVLGAGLGFGYSAPIAAGSRWFPDNLGIVNGLAIGIFAAGSGVFGPIFGAMVDSMGWRDTWRVFAGVFLVFTMTGAFLLKEPPPGYVAPSPAAGGKPKRALAPDVTTSDVLKSSTFYRLWIAYALGVTGGLMIISQLVPFARAAGWSAAVAAFAISVGAAGSATGRFFSGWMSDHFGRLFTLRLMVLLSVLSTPALYLWRDQATLFYASLFVVYYCYGTQLSVYTALAGDFWGLKYISTNYGLMLLAWGFAGILGPQIGARIFVGTGSYMYAFGGSAVLALLALGLLFTVGPPQTSAVVAH